MTVRPPEPALHEGDLHGGDLDTARSRFPNAPTPWIDLSTGINPHAYPVPDFDTAAWARLPQASDERALTEAACRRYGVANGGMLVAAPGTQTLIQRVPRLLPSCDVAVLGPTYSEHGKAWRREGHRVREVGDLTEIGEARAVVIVNPNNPTGRMFSVEELRGIAAALEERRGLLVIDEAFADAMDAEASLIPQLPRSSIVLRSFGKMYGLPGVRLGFAVAAEDIAAGLRDDLGPWSVPVPALQVGTAALNDDVWLDEIRETLKEDGSRLDGLLTGFGCEIVGATPLFRLIAHDKAGDVALALGEAGVYVRQFPEHPRWLRFGLPGDEAAWQRLQAALHTWSDDA
ncbi:Threonine-phosphate decarboxylase [Methyloligella halotolerans]|uniref:threonine-phosphate decarboxylase n=1 Tax=Methyloligella halotolerans TaxID=1177755 RepID=A0A1E2S1E8_9HYPH|nr:threonine-phosphate decarboxylase CobD [Methyloligella halotolerans]ODA68274.1 Threonine-phosphate decarboxylase [Methyloligella halotolerans]